MDATPADRFWTKVNKNGPISPRDGTRCWLWAGSLDRKPGLQPGDGYGRFWVSGHQACAHRFVYELIVGPIPAGWTVDHRDTCPRRCVNPDHLRAATYKQQNENRPGAQGRSGVRGVYWGKDRDKWRVLVIHNRKKYAGGDFDDLADANVAAVALRNRLFTHNDADRQSS